MKENVRRSGYYIGYLSLHSQCHAIGFNMQTRSDWHPCRHFANDCVVLRDSLFSIGVFDSIYGQAWNNTRVFKIVQGWRIYRLKRYRRRICYESAEMNSFVRFVCWSNIKGLHLLVVQVLDQGLKKTGIFYDWRTTRICHRFFSFSNIVVFSYVVYFRDVEM